MRKLSSAQKRIIRLMQNHGYRLVWSREQFFWELRNKEGKPVNCNLSTSTARALISVEEYFELQSANSKSMVYQLTKIARETDFDAENKKDWF